MASTLADLSKTTLYFDYQASTPVDKSVVAAMLPCIEAEFGNPHSGEHMHGQSALKAIEVARDAIADCISANPDDVIFTSGATEANNLAILGPARGQRGQRNKILVGSIEHSSVLEAARASGLEVVHIPVHSDGLINIEWLTTALSDDVLLVSVGYVNNEIGSIQEISRIASLVQNSGALFHVDAAQAITGAPICVSDYPVDFMSLSSHKAYGPKGIGALYIAPGRRTNLQPIIFGGGQEHGMRAGTLPTPLCVGFGAACSIIYKSGESERLSVTAKRDYFYDRLRNAVPGIELVGHAARRHPGNLSLRLPVDDARDLVQLLYAKVSFSTGSACHSGSELPSHVLTNCGLSTAEARRVVRLSLGRFTTIADCDMATQFIRDGVIELQRNSIRRVG